MGQDKALLDHDGQSQLAYVVSVLEACVEKVFAGITPVRKASLVCLRAKESGVKSTPLARMAGQIFLMILI